MLTHSAARLEGVFFWALLPYLIEGMVFLLTGLEARTLIDRIGDLPAGELLASAAAIGVVVIAARFVWVFPATYLPRWLIPALARRDPAPDWRAPFMFCFTRVPGIASPPPPPADPLSPTRRAPL